MITNQVHVEKLVRRLPAAPNLPRSLRLILQLPTVKDLFGCTVLIAPDVLSTTENAGSPKKREFI